MGDIFTVTLPDIGEGVVEGEVIEWLKKEGDSVTQDEPVVIVMTDKATVELPAPYPGKIAKHYFQQGQIAIKDKPLYDIELMEGKTAKKREIKEPEVAAIASSKSTAKEQQKSKTSVPVARSEEALAIPSIRHLAKEMGIDLHAINGSGKDGRITAEDLFKKQKNVTTSSTAIIPLQDDEEIPLIGIKALMARKMAESKANIPHFSYFEQADASRLIQLRNNIKKEGQKEGVNVTFMPFIIKAMSLCIQKYPYLNSTCDHVNSKVFLHKQHNIGIAVSTKFGLIVPVLKGVETMTLEKLIRAYEDLIQRAQSNKLHPHEMKESTITISNFGGVGSAGLWATPVINYPEAAILALARIHKQAIVKDDSIVIRDMLNLSWSFDHRIIDGDMAAHISHEFCGLIQNPATLL